MGGALATLGLLTSCQWDNDELYQPRFIGTYLLADSTLFFLPPSGPPERLRPGKALAADGAQIALLAESGKQIFFYKPGQRAPTKTVDLAPREPATDIAPKPEETGFYISGPTYWASTKPDYTLAFEVAAPTHRIYSGSTFILRQVGDSLLYGAPAQRPLQSYAEAALPGAVQAAWGASPLGMEGTFRYRDTLFGWRYHAPSRLFSWDTITPTQLIHAAQSPYLSQRLGTEYLGRLELTHQGVLNPIGVSKVICFAVDFLGGRLYYVRQDTLWEYDLQKQVFTPRSAPFLAKRLQLVAAYAYGTALITTK